MIERDFVYSRRFPSTQFSILIRGHLERNLQRIYLYVFCLLLLFDAFCENKQILWFDLIVFYSFTGCLRMILSAHLMIRRRLRQMFENILIDLIDTDAFADFTKCRRN